MMLWKCCAQFTSKFEKFSSGHRTGKGQFSFQSQRKAISKNAQTTAKLHSSPTLVKWCLKFFKPAFSNTWTMNFQIDVQAGFRKGRGTKKSNCQHPLDHEKVRVFQKNIYFCIIDYVKAFDCMEHNKLWKILKEMGIPDHLTCLLRNLYASQETTVRTGHGTTDWFQRGKGVHQGCIQSPDYLIICRVHHEKRWAWGSRSWNQDCWEKYK